jgi:hypothetical protein
MSLLLYSHPHKPGALVPMPMCLSSFLKRFQMSGWGNPPESRTVPIGKKPFRKDERIYVRGGSSPTKRLWSGTRATPNSLVRAGLKSFSKAGVLGSRIHLGSSSARRTSPRDVPVEPEGRWAGLRRIYAKNWILFYAYWRPENTVYIVAMVLSGSQPGLRRLMLALASPRTSIEQGEEGVPVSTEAKFASMSGRPLPPSPFPLPPIPRVAIRWIL